MHIFVSKFPLILDIKIIIKSSNSKTISHNNFNKISEKERVKDDDQFNSLSCFQYQKFKRKKERLVVLRYMLIRIVEIITN